MDVNTENSRRRIGAIGLGIAAVFCFVACQGEPEPGEGTPENGENANESDVGINQGDDAGANQDDDTGSNQGGTDRNQRSENNDDIPEPDLDEVTLAADEEAMLPIVVGAGADPSMTVAAGEFAEYLERMSGAEFDVEEGDGTAGIVVGVPDDFDALPMDDVEFGDGTFEREDYVIRSTDEGLYILGSTPLAVRFGVWDVLYRFGHRQFFPPETWEVVPEHDELKIAIDVREEPDYYNRQGPRGAMRMDHRPWAQEAWEDWQIRNRITPTFTLSTGHVYDSVIANNQAAFDANPEYWGLVDGQRTSNAQPNVAHEDVQQMFIDYAINRFSSDSSRDSVAMDPRDGNRWSESTESQDIGGPSEQAVHLANLVAEAVVEEFGEDKYVGMYGYSHHSPPPEIDVHPNVIISLATAFIRGGYTFEEMIDGWSERSNMIGIREYYGLWVWDQSLPGHGAHAANTEYLRETIPHFHDRGARFMNAESSDSWGPQGLGYYLASRMMWDVGEAERMEELIDDFVTRAFGPASEPMAEFYALIDGSATDPYAPEHPRPLNDDMVGRMYRLLDEARELAEGDDEVLARIDDLILYTHYVELYREFDETEGAERQEIFDEFVSYAWRTRETMMAESVELVRELNREVSSDDNLSWAPGRTVVQPSYIHQEGADEPFSEQEIQTILEEGIANHALLDFDMVPWEDSGVLEPAGFAPDVKGTVTDRIHRGVIEAVVYTDDGTMPEITASAGHIYDNFGPLRWSVEDEDGNVVDSGEVPPDEQEHTYDITAPGPGKYYFSITNTGQGYRWSYDSRGAKMTIFAGGAYELRRNWFDRLYFYVPEGIDEIYIAGTMMEGRHDFLDGDGQLVEQADIDVVQGYTIVPVPEGQDGEVWTLDLVAWRPAIAFLNVPGYVALSPDELLLPEEVVDGL